MIRYLTAGESHGQMLVGIIEGMPAGVVISSDYINHQLWRRQQGYGRGGRMKIETDRVEIVSGVRFGKTLGSPIALLVRNKDWQHWTERMAVEGTGRDTEKISIPRPGHVDYAGSVKYGFDDMRNAIERGSARETAMRVACCTIVRKMLEDAGIFIGSHVLSIGSVMAPDRQAIEKAMTKYMKASCGAYKITEEADKSEVRILDSKAAKSAIALIKRTKKKGDTLGGVAEIIVSGVPVGLGSYVHYDRKLDGQLAQALMSIQAVKGVEIGSGFAQAEAFGSQVHDAFQMKAGTVRRSSNRAGGLEGGVTNGETILLHAAMKPIATLANPLNSVDLVSGRGVKARYERSDVCAVPAFSVICEAVIAPVLANAFLEKFGGDSLPEVLARTGRKSPNRRR